MKRTQSLIRIGAAVSIAALSLAAAARAATYNWNTTNGTWDTSTANWTGAGSTWVDGSDAVFNNTANASTISLGETINATSVILGSAAAANNNGNYTLAGGALNDGGTLVVQGNSTNSGVYASNPTTTINSTVAVSGSTLIGRANFRITGGTYTTDRITANPASADWANVTIAGGNVTATNGIDGSYGTNGSNGTTATFQLNLNGGTLCTPSIKVADREAGANNNAWLTFNGTTVRATASTATFITLYGGNQTAYISNGGAILDTNGHDITIGVNLNNTAGQNGSLQKTGGGTLTLTGTNTFTGGIAVSAGSLRLTLPLISSASPLNVSSGATLDLDFNGSVTVAGLVLDGVAQGPGVYDASTHPSAIAGTGKLRIPVPVAPVPSVPAAGHGLSSFSRMKYGFFVHYVTGGGSYTLTVNKDGSSPAGINDLANRFDVPRFAADLASMGVEYVIFTAWHANMNLLGPSQKLDQWIPGHTSQRDLLGEMIDAVKSRGIRVLLYTHPRDGHDMGPADQAATGWAPSGYNPDWSRFDRQKWNNFINDVYGDLVDRYGDRIDGLYLDEGSPSGDSQRVVDYPRLRQTIKARHPDLLMIQNNYGNLYSCDIGDKEIYYGSSWSPGSNPNAWPALANPMSLVMGSIFWASVGQGTVVTRYNTTEMFRLTVLRAGINSADGGGVNWAAGPYPGGDWEDGVLGQMQQLGSWIAPIRASICNTLPSQSWITAPSSTINSIANGIVATRSAADGREFIHVLRPPEGNSLTVPAPADGRGYASASLLENGIPVAMVRGGDGSITFTLDGCCPWNPRNTVIALEPVTVTWTGADNTLGANSGVWSDSMDNFNGGIPVATRFRNGDNVRFNGAGHSDVYFQQPDGKVGDLAFSGIDHHIYPSGAATMNLTTGNINVAAGFTTTFHETGAGGSLRLAGAAGLTKSGAGTLVLDLPSDATGSTVLSSGVLSIRAGALGGDGSIAFNGGTLRYLPGNTQDLSARIRHSESDVVIDSGGGDIVWATPLSGSNAGGLVKLGSGTLSLGGGASVLAGPFIVKSGRLKLAPAGTGLVSTPNSGFESPAYNPQAWAYAPSNTGWTFTSSAGIASNGSPWISAAPEGTQGAFLQNNGAMSCQINVSATGDYLLSFRASNRPGYVPSGVVVSIDGTALATFLPGRIGLGGDFNEFKLPATRLSVGTHTLAIQGRQNGSDSGTIIDDVRFAAAAAGALPAGAVLELGGADASFEPGPGSVTLDALDGIAGSSVVLAGTELVVTGNDHDATFAGSITGTGNLTNAGTLRLVGDATLGFSGKFINNGVLDVMTWNGTLPADFVNSGIVFDRSAVKISSCSMEGNALLITIHGYSGHSYQLQSSLNLQDGSWQNSGAPVPGNNEPITITVPDVAKASRSFFRFVVVP